MTIGHPMGNLEWSFVELRVAGLNRIDNDGNRYVQLDGPINAGNSGGPVLDESGRCVGVAYAEWVRAGEGWMRGAVGIS